jgi:hypothetical protein
MIECLIHRADPAMQNCFHGLALVPAGLSAGQGVSASASLAFGVRQNQGLFETH